MHAGETAVVCDRLLRNERRAWCMRYADLPLRGVGAGVACRVHRSRGSPPLEVEGVRLVRSGGRVPAALVEFYRTLLQVGASTSGAEVLIDSSNWPRYVRFLREVAGTNWRHCIWSGIRSHRGREDLVDREHVHDRGARARGSRGRRARRAATRCERTNAKYPADRGTTRGPRPTRRAVAGRAGRGPLQHDPHAVGIGRSRPADLTPASAHGSGA